MKPTGTQVAARAVDLATGPEITYAELDCQAFIEQCVIDCGGTMAYAGSNDMARHAAWLGTLANAQAEGKLVPGACVLIHEDDESGLPAKYRGDGLGDFSHIGMYVGESALTDVDKNGKARICNVVHSSASMGRVAGSTLRNGWTHVMLFGEIDCGVATGGLALGAEVAQSDAEAEAAPIGTGIVTAANGKPVKMRQKPSTACGVYWLVPCGMAVEVLSRGEAWSKIRYLGRTGYMMTKFIA